MALARARRPLGILVGSFVAATAATCNGGSPSAPSGAGPIGSGQTDHVIVVGDIGVCGPGGTAATAALTASLSGQILLAGDLAYPHGRAADFQQCFDPPWGRFRDRWFAVPGNHDYETAGAAAFFDYFGDAAGSDRSGYFALRVGQWQVLMLNSNVPAQRGTPQWDFARRELELDRRPCTMAVWHHPLFSSGPNGATSAVRDLYALLEVEGVDLVVNGHEHLYERFAKQTADGRPSERGLRQFTAGTGGAPLYQFAGATANSEVRLSQFGVLRLALLPGAYRWEFVPVSGGLADSGTELCH